MISVSVTAGSQTGHEECDKHPMHYLEKVMEYWVNGENYTMGYKVCIVHKSC
jgi:hypothetical protein